MICVYFLNHSFYLISWFSHKCMCKARILNSEECHIISMDWLSEALIKNHGLVCFLHILSSLNRARDGWLIYRVTVKKLNKEVQIQITFVKSTYSGRGLDRHEVIWLQWRQFWDCILPCKQCGPHLTCISTTPGVDIQTNKTLRFSLCSVRQ